MSTAEIITAVLALLNIVGGLVGKYVIDELKERIKQLEAENNSALVLARLDAHKEVIESLLDQVGRSSEEGMRRSLHFSEGTVRVLSAHSETLDRRLTRVEERVFNGHRVER